MSVKAHGCGLLTDVIQNGRIRLREDQESKPYVLIEVSDRRVLRGA
jgi:hypothetical protein